MAIRCLAFDLTGTVFDWHRTLINTLKPHWPVKSSKTDLIDFAGEYNRATVQAIIEREQPSFDFEDVVRAELVSCLERYEIKVSSEALACVVDCWNHMECWIDAPSGLARLRSHFKIAAFTVLTPDQATGSSAHNRIVWDQIISCHTLGVYKTHRRAYSQASAALKLQPAEIMMVACHTFDLDAAKLAGFSTAYVHRAKEYGRATEIPDRVHAYDLCVQSIDQLATAMAE